MVDKAIAICRRLTEDGGDDGALEYAAATYRKALLLDDIGQHAEALPLAQDAVTRARPLVHGLTTFRAAAVCQSADAHVELGRLLSIQGRHEEAAAAYEEAVTGYQRLRWRWTYQGSFWVSRAKAQTGLANEYLASGRHLDALKPLHQASDVLRVLSSRRGSLRTVAEPAHAWLLSVFAQVRAGRDEHESACELAAAAVVACRRLAMGDSRHQLQLAWTLGILGAELSRLGHHDEAIDALREAGDIYRPLTATSPGCSDDLAKVLYLLAAVLAVEDHLDESIDVTAELDTQLRTGADESAERDGFLAAALNVYALRLDAAGRTDEGRVHHQEAVAIIRRLAHADPARHEPALAEYLHDLANHLDQASDDETAHAAAEEAAAIRRRLVGGGAGDE